MRNHKSVVQFIKFGIVGISNTLLTVISIWFLLKELHCSDYFSNLAGYIIGLLNSFIWNRKWTFESETKLSVTVFKFIVTFVLSYFFQLGNLYLLLHYTHIDPFYCQILSIIVYTLINFILNKYYTFKN